jgi:hypothetical protein
VTVGATTWVIADGYIHDREPVGPYTLTVPARRAHHQRFNDLSTIAYPSH